MPILTVKGLDSEPLCVPVTSPEMKIDEFCASALSEKGVSSNVNPTLYLCLEEKKGNSLEKSKFSLTPLLTIF